MLSTKRMKNLETFKNLLTADLTGHDTSRLLV